jgi:hypothetical protein
VTQTIMLWCASPLVHPVLNAIIALPTTIAGLTPNRNELQGFDTALADYGDGASVMAGSNAQIVQIAETTHDYAEKALQIGGAITIGGAKGDITDYLSVV